MGVSYMTQEGYDKLVAEIEELKSTGRSNVAKAIAEAREKGDLSENAEYDAAKDAQGLLEAKINKLEVALSETKVIDESTIDTSQVSVLTKVKIKNKKNGMEATYKLVSSTEANLKEKKISVSSPMGAGLLGKKVGEVAQVQTPGGTAEFEVLDISI